MKTGKLISSGHFAEIFAYDSENILKLYYPQFSQLHAIREAENTRLAYEAGAPAPRLKEIVQQGSRTGLVIEHIQGPTLTELSAKHPWMIAYYAREFARVHAAIHALPGAGFPDQQTAMRFLIGQTRGRLGDQTENIVKQLNNLPVASRLCHNDIHQDNIIVTKRGSIVIDWSEAFCGHPHADVAHALLIQERPVPVPGKPGASPMYTYLHNRHRRWFGLLYLKEYCKLTSVSKTEIERWLLPVAAARLISKPLNEKDWTEGFIRDRLRLIT